MLRICIVKQKTSYDLYTKMGPDLRSIVESSNWRSGPIGLWEVFDCEVIILNESRDRECQIGRKHWRDYVNDLTIWPENGIAYSVEDIDWSVYDIVISIDIAVPSRIVKKFRNVLWCYYFIEGGPLGIDTIFRGSPFYGYNVFLNHRLAKTRLCPTSKEVISIINKRRAVLNFPYYVQSSASVQKLYPELSGRERKCILLSHHSYDLISEKELEALSEFGEIRRDYNTISDIHKLEMVSKYFIVHPKSKSTAGLALIEAISAGCLIFASRKNLWGFPDLVDDKYNYNSISELIDILRQFEESPELYQIERENQARRIDEWCFNNPTYNLEYLYQCFKKSTCSYGEQYWDEKYSFVKSIGERVVLSLLQKLKSAMQLLKS